mmetsp:Transcript_58610/g.182025  ORF Transcript_58610/g.182025 Transcript_58610/m.182025 type:complete len:200 (-) Transcript_58610:278-877(-)
MSRVIAKNWGCNHIEGSPWPRWGSTRRTQPPRTVRMGGSNSIKAPMRRSTCAKASCSATISQRNWKSRRKLRTKWSRAASAPACEGMITMSPKASSSLARAAGVEPSAGTKNAHRELLTAFSRGSQTLLCATDSPADPRSKDRKSAPRASAVDSTAAKNIEKSVGGSGVGPQLSSETCQGGTSLEMNSAWSGPLSASCL